MKKIYLAGPDIFRPDSKEHGELLKRICEQYGLDGKFPLDNQVDLTGLDSGPEKGVAIYKADISLIDECDAIIANLTPFRGISADPGTCFELGYAVAQGKPVAIYTSDQTIYKARAEANGYTKDSDGNTLEDFGMVDNLMMIGPTNNTVHTNFEDAILDLAAQLKGE